ncbi:MAG: guanylate kinase [Candidatus Omnitrophota bacterium]
MSKAGLPVRQAGRIRHKGRGKIFVVSGPSGSGKTTLVARLARDKGFRNRLIKSVSFTTRRSRPGEKRGRDYLFISEKEFKLRRKEQKILEWTRYLGYYYATPKEPVECWLRQGQSVILCLDLKGARRIRRVYPKEAVTIFIIPPSLAELRARIEKRCRTATRELKQRLRLAQDELAGSREYDYTVANSNFSQALKELKGIILGEINYAVCPH